MKIYVAGSFRHSQFCRLIAQVLRKNAHEVYLFCDTNEDTFQLSTMIRESGVASRLNMRSAMSNETVRRICELNNKKLYWADALVVVLPCGKSAHLEAGMMIGCGKQVYVIGELIDGEWDAMYGMMHGVFGLEQLDELLAALY